MRHRIRGRKLNRTSAHRRAMLKNLVSSLFLVQPDRENGTFERVITTREKAKEARRLAEKGITLGKKGTLAARRRAIQLIGNKAAVRRAFEEIAPRYTNRPGGYSRIIGFPSNRLGDNARRVIFELVGPLDTEAATRPAKPEVDEKPADETTQDQAHETTQSADETEEETAGKNQAEEDDNQPDENQEKHEE